jgi:hypothetical protein
MLYAYFGGRSADKRSSYELVLEQRGAVYTLMALLTSGGAYAPASPLARWGLLRPSGGSQASRRLYIGSDVRRSLLILLQAACAANLAELGQRFCYVLPSAPSQGGALAALIPPQLRYDSSLPFHPQLWQAGRPLDTLPSERHHQVGEPIGASGSKAQGELTPPWLTSSRTGR